MRKWRAGMRGVFGGSNDQQAGPAKYLLLGALIVVSQLNSL